MHSGPTEVVFSLNGAADASDDPHAGLFHYSGGTVKTPGPWKRGRPKGATKKASKDSVGPRRGGRKPSQFEFIHATQDSQVADQASRVRIRRHAKLHSFLQLQNDTETGTSQPDTKKREPVEAEQQFLIWASHFDLQQIQSSDAFNLFPIKLEPYMYDLLRFYTETAWEQFYILEKMAGYNPVSNFWLPLAFEDPALTHSYIGCADVWAKGYSDGSRQTRGLKHLQAAIAIVNERLKNPDFLVTGETLVIVSTLAMLEKGSGRYDHWHIHMQGLKRLLQHLGGPKALASKPMILNKIYRADLYGAMDIVQRPYLYDMLLPSPEPDFDTPFMSPGLNAIQDSVDLGKTLRICIHQLEESSRFWVHFDERSPSAKSTDIIKADASTPQPTSAQATQTRHLLVRVQYSLAGLDVEQNSAIDSQTKQIRSLCRLALSLFSMTILQERPPSSSVRLPILEIFEREVLALLRPRVEDLTANSELVRIPTDFYLWAICTAISVMMDSQLSVDDGLVNLFASLVSSQDESVRNWSDLKARLSQYLWIPSLHDTAFRRVWLLAM